VQGAKLVVGDSASARIAGTSATPSVSSEAMYMATYLI
jgi:hypothetical protein